MVDSRMKQIEDKIKHALENKGIKCQSIYTMRDPDDTRVLLAFNSQDNSKLSVRKIENALASLNVGEFKIPREFQRLSSAFLHLEVKLGARTETPIVPGAS
jgi:thiamine kinase-like enzyme